MNSKLTLHPKVVGSGAGGGLAIVVMFVLNLCHVHVDSEGVAGITTVVALVGGYLAPLAKAERSRIENTAGPITLASGMTAGGTISAGGGPFTLAEPATPIAAPPKPADEAKSVPKPKRARKAAPPK